MITPEIKKMTQQMSVRDKIRVLISDHILRCDTKHQKWILTSQEKQNILDSIQKEKQSGMLKDVLDKFNLCLLLMLEVRFAYENFRLAQTVFMMTTMMILTVAEAETVIGQMIHDLAISQINGRSKATKKFDELYTKYTNRKGSFLTKYSCFPSSNDEKARSAFSEWEEVVIDGVESIRRYHRHKCMIDYLIQTSEVNLVEGSTQQEIKEHTEEVENFISHLEKYSSAYLKYQKNRSPHTLSPAETQFFEIAKDVKKACELSDDDKQKAEDSTEDLLRDISRVNFK